MGWKKVNISHFQGADDCAFLGLEEITTQELEAEGLKMNQVASFQDIETIDFNDFVHIDDFNDTISTTSEEKGKKKQRKVAGLELGTFENWESWNLHPTILKGLQDLGFEKPTEIQANTLSHSVIYQKDVIGAAQTGSGKTLAFGLPILNSIANEKDNSMANDIEEAGDDNDEDSMANDDDTDNDEEVGSENVDEETGSQSEQDWEDMESNSDVGENSKEGQWSGDTEEKKTANMVSTQKVSALILVPTRELALQVTQHLKAAGKYVSAHIITIVGGMASQKQERLISKTPDVVVATPGRLWQLMSENREFSNKLNQVKYLVLDEADRMLEQGHFRHLYDIMGSISLKRLKEKGSIKRQTFVFSATMIKNLHAQKRRKKAKGNTDSTELFDELLDKIEFRGQPVYVNVSKEQVTASGVLESKIECPSKQEKDLMLYYLLTRYSGKSIVFVNSIDAIRRLVPIFSNIREGVVGLHAEMQQKQRLKNLERFTSSSNGVLISSDVAARGLDIPLVDHVIHYQIPRTTDTYVHRSGRTARGDKEGVSVMLVSPEDFQQYKKLCKSLGKTEDLPDFPVDRTISARLKQRLNLAKQIDELEHKNKKQKSEKDWFKKAAEEADIYFSVDDSADENVMNAKQRENQKLKSLKNQLAHLLSQPVIPKGQSALYVTMNSDIASLVASQKDATLPTIAETKATEDLKSVVKKSADNHLKRPINNQKQNKKKKVKTKQ